MPTWIIVLGTCAFVVTSVITLWTKAIRPGAKVIAEWERMLPVWRAATDALEDVPEAFAILKEIVHQVRNNSGSSILDMIEKLSKTADDNRKEAHGLAVQLEADRLLAVRDREKLSEIIAHQNRTVWRLDQAIDALTKMAIGDQKVANDLILAQKAVDDMAAGEAAAHERANEVPPGEHGAAADAFSRTPPPPQ